MKNEFITEKGTPIYWDISYSLGGSNPFTNNQEARGYSVSMKRNRNEFAVFASLDDSKGVVRDFLLEVGRKSRKRETEAMNMVTDDYLQSIADRFGI